MNKQWEVHATPYFHRVRCPKHGNDMQELSNGFWGNPVWWCKDCKYPYELKLMKMTSYNQEAVDKQLKEIDANNQKATNSQPK